MTSTTFAEVPIGTSFLSKDTHGEFWGWRKTSDEAARAETPLGQVYGEPWPFTGKEPVQVTP